MTEADATVSEDARRRAQLGLAVAIGLVIATSFVAWFDYAALTAIFHPTQDAAGNLRFQVPGYSNTVYPFTYAAVLVSFLGVAYGVYLRERRRSSRGLACVLALLVANLASIGMVNSYEQVFVALMFFSPALHGYGAFGLRLYWGSAGAVASTVGGLLITLVILPWTHRRNGPGVALCLGVAAAAFAVWFASGFAEPSSGGALAYAMNATSRVATQLALVAAVARSDWMGVVAESMRRLFRPSRGTRRGAATRPTRPEPPDSEGSLASGASRWFGSRRGARNAPSAQSEER